ncbi:Galactokinase [Taenia solium]|eukprot:TsM_000594900 transcript=TsM_000594900 gene=TsM_000594900
MRLRRVLQEVDESTDICMSTSGVFGARMTSGGFRGSLVVLIKPDAVIHLITTNDFKPILSFLTLQSKYSATAKIDVVDAAHGAHLLPKNKRTKSTSKCNRKQKTLPPSPLPHTTNT